GMPASGPREYRSGSGSGTLSWRTSENSGRLPPRAEYSDNPSGKHSKDWRSEGAVHGSGVTSVHQGGVRGGQRVYGAGHPPGSVVRTDILPAGIPCGVFRGRPGAIPAGFSSQKVTDMAGRGTVDVVVVGQVVLRQGPSLAALSRRG